MPHSHFIPINTYFFLLFPPFWALSVVIRSPLPGVCVVFLYTPSSEYRDMIVLSFDSIESEPFKSTCDLNSALNQDPSGTGVLRMIVVSGDHYHNMYH